MGIIFNVMIILNNLKLKKEIVNIILNYIFISVTIIGLHAMYKYK